MAIEQAVFKTSVFGFRKADVLACIDQISAENIALQEQAEMRLTSLQESLDAMREEKDSSVELIGEKDAQLELLQQELAEQVALVLQKRAEISNLEQELKTSQASMRDYKSRLFTREGEATVLRRDNTRLTQTLSEKQQEIEQAAQSIQTVQQESAVQIETIRKEASDEIAQARQQALLEKMVTQNTMKESAVDMVKDVAMLKQALADLDQKIADSMVDLQRSTKSLSQALGTAEDSMQTLGVKLEQFPKPVISATQPKQVRDCHHGAKQVAPNRCKEKPQSISALLLSQISKMIGDV